MEKKTRNILLIVVLVALAAAITTIVLVKGNANKKRALAADTLASGSIAVDSGAADTAVTEPQIETTEQVTEPEVADESPNPDTQQIEVEPASTDPINLAIATGRPVLVDFGRGTCIPCKKMMPILAELKQEYAGRVEVLVLDLDEYLELAKEAGIQMIPTQIFYDASGNEVYRHVGFMEKQAIVEQLKTMGID